MNGENRKFNIFWTFMEKLLWKPQWKEHAITKQDLTTNVVIVGIVCK